MPGYMGYDDLSKSTRIGIQGAIRLAEDHAFGYEITDRGIQLIDPDGKTRSFGANVTAGAIGKFLGYRAGGLVKSKKTNHTDYRKTGMFK
tara:strand:- start:361 stop:630 length:270 start_codon:yes stop_codon:yes gene_type:complete